MNGKQGPAVEDLPEWVVIKREALARRQAQLELEMQFRQHQQGQAPRAKAGPGHVALVA